MLLDATSKIINVRLQRLLKEVGIEEQNGFTGERGCADGNFCIRQTLKATETWARVVDVICRLSLGV